MQVKRAFVAQHRQTYGVEPICKVLQIAPSAVHRYAAAVREPSLQSQRAQRDAVVCEHIKRVYEANW
jgi:putative transposase